MKRISKRLPNLIATKLADFSSNNLLATWEAFRNFDGGQLYKEVKGNLFSEQGNICAYCEVNLEPSITGEHNRRIEHFCSKGHVSNLHLMFVWSNLFGVCVGGTDNDSQNKYEFPENLSCDSHKERIEQEEQIPSNNWAGRVLCPSEIPEGQLAFVFDKKSNGLSPNPEFCQEITIENNVFASTSELLTETLRVFNLNCDRLNSARNKIFIEFEQLKSRYRKQQITRVFFLKVLTAWLKDHNLPFTSTRQSLVISSPFYPLVK